MQRRKKKGKGGVVCRVGTSYSEYIWVITSLELNTVTAAKQEGQNPFAALSLFDVLSLHCKTYILEITLLNSLVIIF